MTQFTKPHRSVSCITLYQGHNQGDFFHTVIQYPCVKTSLLFMKHSVNQQVSNTFSSLIIFVDFISSSQWSLRFCPFLRLLCVQPWWLLVFTTQIFLYLFKKLILSTETKTYLFPSLCLRTLIRHTVLDSGAMDVKLQRGQSFIHMKMSQS